ncbi:hypothetical protein E7T09_12740 [Deinococcus sp. KSM4-11]|uniref:hypothetical protein n=1 Tax=Deinococcus sp. KSM4-11 TaxID=2568654 RepID=UPI0010A46CC9|nr:hypothetical protein [Deinococcus sp. KSM4-11]THF86096.1 hypothetical protein E7T09_12740 [Deinococcus sp. KSM4-11]
MAVPPPSIASLQGIFLDDSFVLGVLIPYRQMSVSILAMLLPWHLRYEALPQGQLWCYRRAELVFQDVMSVVWSKQNIPGAVTVDEDGEDFGTVDVLEMDGDIYRLQGDFGVIEVHSSPPSLTLLE